MAINPKKVKGPVRWQPLFKDFVARLLDAAYVQTKVNELCNLEPKKEEKITK